MDISHYIAKSTRDRALLARTESLTEPPSAPVEAGLGVRQLERDSRRYGEFVLDTYWKRLQPRARWHHAVPRLGTQRASYSDIEQTHVDYGV